MSPSSDDKNGPREMPSGLDIPLLDSLVHLTRLAWRRKYLILLGVAGLLGLAAVYCVLVPPSYRSEAKVLVERKGPRALPIPGVDPQLAVIHDSLSGHQALLTSRLIAERAIERSNLTTLETFSKHQETTEEKDPPIFNLKSWLPSFGRSTKPQPFDPGKVILGGLVVSRQVTDQLLQDRSIAMFNITYTCQNENDGRTILQAVIDGYISYVDEMYRSDSEQIQSLLAKWKTDLQGDLAEKQAAYLEVLEKIHPLQWRNESGVNLSEQRVAEIDDQRLAMLVELTQDSERLQALEKAREAGVNNQVLFELVSTWTRVADEDTTARDQLFDLQLEERHLVKTYGHLHREVAAIRDQIRIVARQVFGPSGDTKSLELMDPVEVYIQSLQRNVKVTGAIARKLEELIEDEHSKTKQAYALNEQLVQLRADEELFRSLQEQVISHLQDVDIAKESEFVETHTLARPSSGKLTPFSRPLVVFVRFGFCGLLLGGGFAMLAETLNRSYRTPHDLERRIHLPILGHIPYFRPRAAATPRPAERDEKLNALLVTYHNPQSADAESFRGLRTALCYQARAHGLKVIQITSPRAGVGKSILVANLAVSLAQAGKHVVLIGADFHRPSLARIFGLSNEMGLANVLLEDVGQEDLDQDVIQPSGVAGLHVLTCGHLSTHPEELLTSPGFQQFLQRLADKYDFVLIDTPPLLAVSDPSVVAMHVDGVLLTICNSRRARALTTRALARLDLVGARALGVVVKGRPRWFGPSGYGYDDSRDGRDDFQSYQANNSNQRRTSGANAGEGNQL